MARRRRGNPVHGWIVVDKPLGVTSTAVVNKARWAYQAQKAGHAGTLDPMATGVLAIAFGEATKTVPFAQEGLKTYRFTVRLGQQTTTDDAEGEVIATSEIRPEDAAIADALTGFTGDIQQVPPRFSAVKINGERAYDLARDGVDVELAARPLYVRRLELQDRPDPDHAVLEMVCGKGGYVRSIARDLGAELGCLGHVVDLRRTASGGFTLEGALDFSSFDDLREADTRPLMALEAGLHDLPQQRLRRGDAQRLMNGNPVAVTHTDLDYGDEAWASENGVPVALVTYKAGMLHPSRVFVL